MPGAPLFISYGHRDMEPFNWLEQLKMYLDPARQDGVIDVWDDSKLNVGGLLREEITTALRLAKSAILLVGPAFLASRFIREEELPVLLEASKTRGCKIYPLIIGYCGYTLSSLSRYTAYNDPKSPLEALGRAEQNKILNDLCMRVAQDLAGGQVAPRPTVRQASGARESMREMARQLEITRTAFAAQCRRRNQLVRSVKDRLMLSENLQYEKFFFRYFESLDREEKFQFGQIRAMTEGPLYLGNQEMYKIMESYPEVLEHVPELIDLRQHLVFWLNKYERVFTKTPEMCVLYTGVEDGVPFPPNIDEQIKGWIKKKS